MQTGDHQGTALRRATLVLLLCFLASPAGADPETPTPWYSGHSGRNRLLHLAITASFGLGYVASETVLKSRLVASSCRWCEPPAIDRSVRDAVIWNNPGRADLYSNINVYALSPIVGFGLLIASDYDAGWARLLDDTIPVAETIAISQLLTVAI